MTLMVGRLDHLAWVVFKFSIMKVRFWMMFLGMFLALLGSFGALASVIGQEDLRRRESSSLFLKDPEQLRRRITEYAQVYGVQILESKIGRAKGMEREDRGFPLQRVAVRTRARGNFHDVVVLLNRLALFSTVQTPQRLDFQAAASMSGALGVVEASWETTYYQLGRERAWRIGNGKRDSLQSLQGMDQANRLVLRKKENGVWTSLLDSLLQGFTAERMLNVDRISWTRKDGFDLRFRTGPGTGIDGFLAVLAADNRYAGVRRIHGRDGRVRVHGFFAIPAEEARLVQAYSPLGKRNPFWVPQAAQQAELTLTELAVDDLVVVSTDTGFLGVGQEAEVQEPSGHRFPVRLGSVVGRYQGVVVEIADNHVVIEERFLDALRSLHTHRTIVNSRADFGSPVLLKKSL